MSTVSGISGYSYAAEAGGVTGAAETEAATDFSALIAETLAGQVQQQAVSLTATGAADDYSGLVNSGLESMLLASAASGEIDQEQIALFMLMMMLQQAQESEGSSQMMGMLATLLTQLGDSGS